MKWFRLRKYNIRVLSDIIIGSEPSKENIQGQIMGMVTKSEESARLYVFLNGHTITHAPGVGIEASTGKKMATLKFFKDLQRDLKKKKLRMTMFVDVSKATTHFKKFKN